MSDEYEAMGELHDLFMDGPWARLEPALSAVFGDLGPDDVVVDLGAGTGVGTATLARCSAARIVAVEPSLTMRTALLTRIAADPRLAERVSVLAGSAPAVLDELPEVVAGFVCAHVLGHMTSPDRVATFERLARSMRPDAVGLLVMSPDAGPEDVAERTVGTHRYVERHEPGTDPHRGVTTYQVLDGTRLVREITCTWTWDPPSAADLARELGRSGLVLERSGGVELVRLA